MNTSVVERVGGATLRHVEYVGRLAIQFQNTLLSLGRTMPLIGNPNRWRSAVRQMLAVGVDASPMVGIMAACAGFILAMQGASELRRFGAMEYVVQLVTIGFARELGPLLTAIAVSGRSGSAFSAEIGSMVVTEEVDALRTMAIDPVEFVLAPKYLAALIVLPCLTIVCSACGILAGAAFMRVSTGMVLGVYLRYVARSMVLSDVMTRLCVKPSLSTRHC